MTRDAAPDSPYNVRVPMQTEAEESELDKRVRDFWRSHAAEVRERGERLLDVGRRDSASFVGTALGRGGRS